MGIANRRDFTAYIGIDWADKKHDACIQAVNSIEKEFVVIPHSVESIDTWARSLKKRFGGPIAIALETPRGPLVAALQKYDFLVLFPIVPSTLAKYRQAFSPSQAKDDPTDAELALDLILRHPERFSALKPQSVMLRTLAGLVEQRRKLVDDRKRLTNRLRYCLKQYYPQALEWFDRIDTPLFCDFIEQWPTVKQARRARKATLINFFHAHRLRRKALLEERITSIKSATPLTDDEAIIVPHQLQVQVLIDQLRILLKAISQFDEQIQALAQQHIDYDLFACLPGAGPSLAPRLLVAFGEDRDRYQTADELQCFSGIAPVTERSGNKQWVHWRYHCPTFLRQTFVEWAAQTINKSYWAGVYYRQQREKGASYAMAVRSLAFKWIRILFRCWKNRQRYDESVYLKALERRGSNLVKQAA